MWHKACKILAAPVGLTYGQPMVITENFNAGQIESEKSMRPQKNQKGLGHRSWRGNLPVMPRSFMINPDSLTRTMPRRFVRNSWG
jgi:hypothetical protein